MRRFVNALLVVALLAVGCGVNESSPASTVDGSSTTTELSSSGSSEVVSAESTRSAGTVPAPSTTEGVEGAATVIPWDVVREGWLLVVTEDGGEDVLAVTGPDGVSYEVMSWPSGSLLDPTIVDWSPDRREALVLLRGAGPVVTVGLWLADLEADEWSLVESVPFGPSVELSGGFTRPSGENLVVMVRDDSGVRLERRNRAGALLATLSAQPSGPMSWLYSPDGTMVVVADRAGISLVSNHGEFIRTLKEPFPEPTVPLENSRIGECRVVRWWTHDTVVATCEVRAANPGSPLWGELWQVPVDGSPPLAIRTNPLSGCDGGPPGYPQSMWLTGLGPLIEVVCPFGVGEDGPHRLGLLDQSNGTTDRIEVAGVSPQNRVAAVSGDEILLVSVWSMGNLTALVSASLDEAESGLVMERLLLANVREVATPERVVSVRPYAMFPSLPTIRDIIEPIEQRLAEDFDAESDLPDWILGPMRLRCEDEDRSVGRGDVFACGGSAQTIDDPRYALDPLSVVFLVLDDSGHVAVMSGTDRPYSTAELAEWYRRTGMGLSCSDLGASYFDALQYWFLEGMPDRMDTDGDGVPCEDEYAFEQIVWVLSGGEDW